jgi:hypothetical protein
MLLPDNFKIDPTLNDHGFCEKKLWGSHPEIFNTMSCLFMMSTSLFAIYKNRIIPKNSYMFFLSLFLNGFSSCGYHYFGTIGWGIADRMSMIMIAFYGLEIMSELNTKTKILTMSNYSTYLDNTLLTDYIYDFFKLTFILLLLISCGLHHENVFNTLFAFFLIYVLYITYYTANKLKTHILINKYAIFHSFLGGVLIAIGCASWVIIETLCNSVPYVMYLHGHALWHVTLSYGAYLLIISASYLLLISESIKYENSILYPSIKKITYSRIER